MPKFCPHPPWASISSYQGLMTTDGLKSPSYFEPPLLSSWQQAYFPQPRPMCGRHPAGDQSMGWLRKGARLWVPRKQMCSAQPKTTPYPNTLTLTTNSLRQVAGDTKRSWTTANVIQSQPLKILKISGSGLVILTLWYLCGQHDP